MRTKIVGLLAVAFSLGVAQAASAADMPVKMPVKAAPVAAPYNWTGCYVGGNGGWKWERARTSANSDANTATLGTLGPITAPADATDIEAVNAGSVALGAQAGCLWQNADSWVWGVEGNFDWTNVHGTGLAIGGTNNLVPGDEFETRIQWESSARLVLGRSWDRVLLYATGGVALASVKMTANYIATIGTYVGGAPGVYPAATGSQTKVVPGLTIGAGTAYAIDSHWNIGAEYLFTAYQKTDFSLGTVPGVCGLGPGLLCTANPVTGHLDLQTHEVLLKLNYKF